MAMTAIAIAALLLAYFVQHRGSTAAFKPTASQLSSCAVRMTDHDATAYFASRSFSVQRSCTNLIQVFANAGELWSASPSYVVVRAGVPYPSDPADDQTVCELQRGSERLVVWDSGGAMFGQQICEAYLASNWTQT